MCDLEPLCELNSTMLSFPQKTFVQIILDNCVDQIKDEAVIQQAISHHTFIVTSQEHWQNKGTIYQCEFSKKIHPIAYY